MTDKILTLLLLIPICIIMAGCVQAPVDNNHSAIDTSSPAISEPVHQIESSEANHTEQPAEALQNQTISVTPSLTPIPTPELTTPLPTSTTAPQKTQDPNIAFMEKTLLSLDDMQAAKEGLILIYQSGDMVRLGAKARELRDLIRQNGVITGMPAKMDYVRLNYYEYTDQASQFSQTFIDGSDRWLASDKSSANSYFDAGIMAASRADIADKRIRKFFEEHVMPTQE